MATLTHAEASHRVLLNLGEPVWSAHGIAVVCINSVVSVISVN